MGVIETKIIQVKNDPQIINAANEAWGRWGWSVLNIQVTHTQNTREYQNWAQYGSNEVTVETTTINYATITYQRDKGIAGYNRLLELEQEYDQVDQRISAQFQARREELWQAEQKLPVVKKAGGRTIAGMVFSAYMIVASIFAMLSEEYKGIPFLSFAIIIAGAAIAFVLCLKRYQKSRLPETKALLEKNEQTLNEINKERSMLNSECNRMIEEEKARILNEASEILNAA